MQLFVFCASEWTPIVGDGFPVPAVHNYKFAQHSGKFAVCYRWEAKRLPYIHYL